MASTKSRSVVSYWSANTLNKFGALAVAVALMWPAFYNGQPYFFYDTTAYLRGADTVVAKLTHRMTVWSSALAIDAAAVKPAAAASDAGAAPSHVSSTHAPTGSELLKDKIVLAGRSPYYGALLYLGQITGGFWASVFLQAAALLAAMALALRAAQVPLWPNLPVIGIVMAAVTSLPFYASFLMPDVFAATTILGCSALIASGTRLRPLDYALWFALLAAALSFHDSHKLIAASLLVLGALWGARRGWSNWRGLACLGAALLLAIGAQSAFRLGVEHFLGAPPLQVPFLTARVIDDGPGYRYLKATCPESGFVVCRYLHLLPMNADQFLWAPGTDPAEPGVFTAAPADVKRKLAEEQWRFYLRAVAFDPLGALRAAVRNGAEQLAMTELFEFVYQDEERAYFNRMVPAEHLQPMQRSAAWRGTVPVGALSALGAGAVLAAALYLAFALLGPGARAARSRSAGAIAGWILTGVLINAAACGMLSAPHDRYAVRVLWLIPFAALLVAAQARAEHRRFAARTAVAAIRASASGG